MSAKLNWRNPLQEEEQIWISKTDLILFSLQNHQTTNQSCMSRRDFAKKAAGISAVSAFALMSLPQLASAWMNNEIMSPR